MQSWTATILILPAVGLLAAGLLPSPWANRGVLNFRQLVISLAGLQCFIAWACALLQILGPGGAESFVLLRWPGELPLLADIYYDGTAALMLSLVSFVGWVICRFSLRYLDGQATQGRYFRWTAFTLGAVCLMVVSGNLLMFVVTWGLTSLGLHQLLLHYAHRPAAQRAAWTKFVVSRLGDLLLLGALALTYAEFRTFEFGELFAAVGNSATDALPANATVTGIGWLLVIGALIKSAQVPFHTWLPQTMETPTPVSALMHAGIVNAGGYLLIRTSPLVCQAPAALATLAVVGGLTACLAAVVMLTQTSIKRSLAYSTVAQMGFMMLQCGLGAFSAAMLHILAHSLYKAHAFLSSGGVIAHRAATDGVSFKSTARGGDWRHFAIAAGITIASYLVAMLGVGISPATKAGGYVLGFILCLALTFWLGQLLKSATTIVRLAGVLTTVLLAWAYGFSYLIVDKIVTANPAVAIPPLSVGAVALVVAMGFGLLFVLHGLLLRSKAPVWLQGFYVHVSNGFYLDAILRRIFGSAAST